MNLLPKSHDEFTHKEYWDSFFKKRGNKSFEWYGEYTELFEYLHKYIKKQDDVLITGCGNSTIGRDLYDVGYNKITNIDISHVVIKQMLAQNARERPQLKFMQMDALETTFEDGDFSVVLDKGTLDALMPNAESETVSKVQKYFKEIQRLLKTGGRYVCISLLQNHILDAILNYFPQHNFMFRVVRCFEAEHEAIERNDSTMPVFMVICTKFTQQLPNFILELNLGSTSDKMLRLDKVEEVKAQIGSVQQAAFVCAGLKQMSIKDEGNEVFFDLFKPGDSNPRFSVYVVDMAPSRANSPYAAFIVPQGREAEWLFASTAGRKHLTRTTKHNRLSIITLHRGQKYGTLNEVQNELSETIRNLAPIGLNTKKIPFLSVGPDVGNRIVKYEGQSIFSGGYLIEDVEIDGEKFRRLFYLKSQLVIQSEAKLKEIKTRKGRLKEVVDLSQLMCKHHIYMSVASHMACSKEKGTNLLIIGLGGGGLCSFLRKLLPKVKILAIDIDEEMLKVATDWFGLKQDDFLKVQIVDGVEFLQGISEKQEKFNAVLFDVDNKDATVGMSCPPKQFLTVSALDNVASVIGDSGLFIVNLVIRDESLRPGILNDLQVKFQSIISFKIEDELNEILICSKNKINKEHLEQLLSDASHEINKFFKKNHSECNDNIEISDFLQRIKIIK